MLKSGKVPKENIMADSYNDYKKASERRRLRVERGKFVPKSELESIYGIPDIDDLAPTGDSGKPKRIGSVLRYVSPLTFGPESTSKVRRRAAGMKNPTEGVYVVGHPSRDKLDIISDARSGRGSPASGPKDRRRLPKDKSPAVVGAKTADNTSGYRGPNRGLSQAKVKVDSSDAVADKKKSSVQGSPPAQKSGTQKTGAASDKSRVAGKMTAFQRMKARQYEKEGVGGRPMTRAAAQKKAASEKSGSLKMPSLGRLFAKQGKVTFAQPPKKGATRSQVAAFRSKMQGRNK